QGGRTTHTAVSLRPHDAGEPRSAEPEKDRASAAWLGGVHLREARARAARSGGGFSHPPPQLLEPQPSLPPKLHASRNSGRMSGLAASALPLAAGPSPLPWCRPTRPSGLTRPPLLKVAELQPCLPGRFASARRLKFGAASGNGRQGLRASQYRFDDDEPLWLAVVREFAVSVRNLVVFLAEQPRQLKHLEWPAFRNTLTS
uniref:Uncharacterized protein n=2 Tax=Aegilops tauschii subsp. strangulata TaxID=200361 RepID=A0A453KYX1_AEGTS